MRERERERDCCVCSNVLDSDHFIYFLFICMCSVAQACLALCNPMDFSPLGSSVHEILQARILESVAIAASSGYSPCWDGAHVCCLSCIFRWILHQCAPWQALSLFFYRQCYIYFFTWLLRVLVEVCGILFLVKGWNPGPLHWEHRVLTNGQQGKFLDSDHFRIYTYILSV